MGPPPPRTGTFSPNNPQALQTGSSHSPHPSLTGGLSAGASPSTSSPTGTSVSKISIAQVYLLLSTIKEDKDDPTKWDLHTEQLRKLIDDNGMEVFTRYFARLVAGNASQIFPGISRPGSNAGNIHILAGEMRKIAHEPEQARKIAESIEQGTEDIFRDFDLSTFMEHFKLDPLEKTILALAFKLGTRSDLRTKADAILSTNYPTFLNILSRPAGEHADLSPSFISLIIDRFIQEHPPTFATQAKSELILKVSARFAQADQTPPPEVMAALDLLRILGDKSSNALTMYIKKTGAEFTRDPDVCVKYLQNRPSNAPLGEELVANALMYTTISQAPKHNPAVLVRALRQIVGSTFRWQAVVSCFDQCDSRVSSEQFLRLFNAVVPVAQEDTSFDIQQLWGGNWENTEAQLSFICALTSLGPEQLDITSVPGVQTTLTLDDYSQSAPAVRERASVAVKHPLVSMAAILAIFHVALKSTPASDTPEAKRLFQQVVVPNLDIFVVSAFNVPKPWPGVTDETLTTLFDNFLYERSPWYDFVLDSLWRKDSAWVRQRLVDAHALRPHELPYIVKHAVNHRWVDQLVSMTTGFGLDLAAMAHAEGRVDFAELARNSGERQQDLARYLLQFLAIKAEQELKFQRQPDGNVPIRTTTPLRVKTVYVLLSMLSDFLPKHQPIPELIRVQRTCITVYPRLINYGGDFDDIIDANGREGNALPPAANAKMELHYKKMYSDEVEVREIVQVLENYKRSRDTLDQDIFACMIHGLFDEYIHFAGYPLEALATTAVLFGGIIAQKLIADIPLEVGLGMILQAVQENTPNEAMYKFGLQALMQLFGRLKEWPGFCAQLLQVPGLQGTEAWKKAEDVIRNQEESMASTRNGGDALANGNAEEGGENEHHPPPFTAINVDRRPADPGFEDPDDDTQGKIQFVLNNITENTLQVMFKELAEMLERGHKQWFASHLVEERAKMQPNYHDVYLKLVEQFGDKSLWAEVLRETYISVSRILNAEATAHNSTDRMHLKNLGGWLGLLTLARDKPIKHKNIAFKQLLMEAHDTKRLLVVIPFVCKVLIQGKKSTVFQKQNPWLMDIIHLLIELYHNAELKLNLKFEIEVLCKGLELDHKSIEPSGELLNRVMTEDAVDLLPADTLEPFENLSLNGLAPGVGSGLSPHAVAPSIPDLTPFLQIPPVNEMVVSHERMTQITNQAITKALSDIIGPVVDRSVTIAAISTQQMIHKDFGTEPDENRVRTSAINMVKATAGSLALVTSREPLRVNIGNYMRSLSSDLPQGLPEGNIHMAVNMNLDLASREIEKAAEERAVPEIEEMLELELEARRRHRATRPNEPYVDAGLSRWAWTIPNPYKLSPNMSGLNPEQMAIYENFARQQPRTTAASAPPTHAPSQSDASRSLANEVLQDQYNSVPTLPTPAETPAIPPMGSQQIGPYSSQQHSSSMVNGRQHGLNLDARALAERVQKFLLELQRVAMDAEEEHFSELPRPHQILDIVDALVQLLIKAQQASEDLSVYAAELISQSLFGNPAEKSLVTETFVHVLNTLRKIASPALNLRVTNFFQQQTGEHLRNLTLISSLVNTDLLNWRHVDNAIATAIKERKSGSIEFLEKVMDLTVFNDTPVLLFVEFVHSLDEAWTWIQEDSELAEGKSLQAKVLAPANEPRAGLSDDELASLRQDQMEYVFEEWVRLFTNPWASEKFGFIFVQQMYGRGVISSKDDIATFTRIAMDKSVDICELNAHAGGSVSDGYLGVDSLSRLVSTLMKLPVENPSSGQVSRLSVLECALSVSVLLANHHQMTRGELFNQRVFFRFFSVLLHEIGAMENLLSEVERHDITLLFARRLDDLGPSVMPGFVYAWVSLLQHKEFLPFIFKVPGNAGWPLFTRLLTQLLSFSGEQLKALNVSNLAKDLYRGTLKFMLVLQHDFPDYLAANYIEICRSIPAHCTQLTNMVLVATPNTHSKMPDPLHSGVQVDRIDESREPPFTMEDPTEFLRQTGLQGVLDQCLQSGPSEDAIAHITHAINRPETRYTIYGNVPLSVNLAVIEAVVAYLGLHAVVRVQKGGQPFMSKAFDISTLSILVHELSPEGRYFVLSSVVHRLRYANAHTTFFSQALLEIFGTDMADAEETEIRQQICRILLERLVGFFPQPWGLLVTVAELIKNDKYQFFELPFIKSSPDVAERFVTILASRRDFAM
ncbi:hypothetical protein MGG_02476 [Pyricularia oryzae 70-15]|uniref:General negative regulator of transcription subunit 1 n=1 Tax=Pyricularia oryzae (strain 70-15 / ATCC MYA-4617 / FGSC 8958) TaxID=242507 RepID=G4MRY9_PYRO7|nr:uncharacterized protein MGG_02476 [Pyricularia oryzae 70-15]EHA56658.1 hypothetical protein MGG_02476 [Pyricularia oryzae 70-15]